MYTVSQYYEDRASKEQRLGEQIRVYESEIDERLRKEEFVFTLKSLAMENDRVLVSSIVRKYEEHGWYVGVRGVEKGVCFSFSTTGIGPDPR